MTPPTIASIRTNGPCSAALRRYGLKCTEGREGGVGNRCEAPTPNPHPEPRGREGGAMFLAPPMGSPAPCRGWPAPGPREQRAPSRVPSRVRHIASRIALPNTFTCERPRTRLIFCAFCLNSPINSFENVRAPTDLDSYAA